MSAVEPTTLRSTRLDGLAGARVLVTGGAGTIGSTIVDQLVEAGRRRDRRARQPRPRPAREPRPTPLARRAGRRSSRATSATATWSHELTAGMRPRLPPGRHPDHPVRRGAPAGPRGAGRRHLQRARGRGRGRGRQGRRRVVGLGLRPGRGVPDHRATTTPTTTTRSTARPRLFNEGLLRSFHAMYGLDYVALRYFNVYGPRMDIHGVYTEVLVRWMERIAPGEPPLIFGDGSRRWTSSSSTTSPGPTSSRGQRRRHRRGLQRRQRRPRPACCELADALLRVMGSRPRTPSTARSARSTGRPPARRHAAARDATSASRPRSTSTRACASSSTWWRTSATASAPSESASCADGVTTWPARRPIPVMRPWLGDEEAERRGRGDRAPAGSPRGRGSPSSSARSPRGVGARRRRRRVDCTTGAAPGAGRRSASGRATRSSSRRSRSSPPPTPCCTSGATPGLRRRRPGHAATSRADSIGDVITAATAAVIVVDQGGVPADLEPIRDAVRPARHRRGRGRRLRHRLDLPRARPSAPARSSPRSRSTRASSSPPARAACSPLDDPSWSPAPATAARARHERQRGRPARASGGLAFEQYLEAGFNYRMTDLQAAVGLVQLARLDEIVERRRELAARYHEASGDVAGPALRRRPGVGHDELPVVLGRGSTAGSRSPATSCWRAFARRRDLEPAAASWPPTSSRPTSASPRGPLPVTERLTRRLAHPAAVPRDDRRATSTAWSTAIRRLPSDDRRPSAGDRRCGWLRARDG